MIAEFTLNENIIVYPNPASEYIIMEHAQFRVYPYQIEIFNLSGKKLYHKKTEIISGKNTHSINISALPEGIYIYQIKNNNEIIGGKFIKN